MLVARPLRPDRPPKPVIRSVLFSLALGMASGSFARAAEPLKLEAVAVRTYDIAPGPLGAALSSFAVDAGIALSFQPSITEGLLSPGLSGTYPAQEAVARLLGDSGVQMVARDDGSYTLVLRQLSLPQITVATPGLRPSDLPPTYLGDQVARGARLGLLGNTDVMDAPLSINSYTSTLIKDQQAVTVGDVLERDPSVRSTGQTGGIVDSFFIRGFPVGEGNLGELTFDGVYGVASNYRVFTDYAERVELVKGPGALLYGVSPNSGVGGVINLVPKRPLDEDLTRFSTRYAMNSQLGGHLDLSRRFGEERQFGLRLNTSTQQGDTAIDKQTRDVGIGAISLDYQGERLRATLDLINQKEKFDAASRPFLIEPGIQIPSAANGRTSVSQDWGRSETQDKSALLGGEYDLSDTLTVFAHAGGGQSNVERLSDQTPTIINEAGDTSSTPGYYKFKVQRYTVDAGARLAFDTGLVSHSGVLQITRYRDELSRGIISGPGILSNIYHPIDRPRPTIGEPDTPKVSESELSGVALADTLSVLDERLKVTVGLRRQDIKSDNYDAAGAVTTAYDKSATTPLFGVVTRPWEHVSLYYNYVEGLGKGDIAPSAASNAGEIFSPYRSRQQEVGIKLDYGSFMSTLALFQIKKPSGELASGVFSVQGQQRNRGVEWTMSGELAPGTRLLGGITLLDGELTRSGVAANRGNRPVGVPKVQANLWAEWDAPGVDGLTLTSGVIHTASQYVDQANTQELDAWTRVDVGARYATRIAERPTTFRASVQNVFDREYWSGVASYGAFSQGSPRTLLLSATVDF
ncbi:TonB-dependent receptor [Pseudomonas sp. RGM2987]|uniref:TonB-dependent receptor n=1 Tax=Pseudomonas sp. RGM2987 TaxID=2930090 RepID=UPI001FD708CC|nr:TonB-dependent receptor [Pseudomonas sp. RGM2987]MCJ8207922.1 TonB-dependent receptor [Pseudomonas sp. RGM2987]